MSDYPQSRRPATRQTARILLCLFPLLTLVIAVARPLIPPDVTASALDSTPKVVTVQPAPDATQVALDAAVDGTIQINFTEPVTLTGPALELVCPRSGVHTLFIAGGGAAYTFTSSKLFLPDENCTATLLYGYISDQDTDDPPDTMLAHYVWAFRTEVKPVVINELNAISPSGLTDFVELFDGGQGDTDLTGLTLVFYRGDEAMVYLALSLDGYRTDERGYFVVGTSNTPGSDLKIANGTIRDGPDAVALYSAPAYEFPNNEPVTTDDLIDAVVYGQAGPELMVLMLSGQSPVDENARGSASSDSSQRCPNGGGLPRTSVNFIQEIPTADNPNKCITDSPPAVVSVSPAAGEMDVPADAVIEVTFSEPVLLDDLPLEIACTISEHHSYTVQGLEANWQFLLDSPLHPGESCVVSIFPNKVHDADTIDPPDELINITTWSFSVAKPVATNVVINEIDTDTPGEDTAEFIELYDGGQGNTSLDGLIILLFNGANDQSYQTINLSGGVTDSSGYYLLANSAVAGADQLFSNGLLQNGADAVALIAGKPANFPNGTDVEDVTPMDAIVYGSATTPDAGLLALLHPGQPQVDEAGRADAANHSNQRCPNGQGGARNTTGYKQNTPTPGMTNDCLTDVAPAILSTTPASGATGVSIHTHVTIAFSEPVEIQTNWAQVSCNLSGPHVYQVSGGPTTFTLTITTPLAYAETCTVTIAAGNVKDIDSDDPPDTMAENVSWSFTTAAKPADFVLINEIDPDTLSTDTAEFIELFDGGIGQTLLDGLTLVLFNGSDNSSYWAIDLDGLATDASGYFVVGNPATEPGAILPNGALQNGPDAVALYIANASDFPPSSAITLDGLLDAVVYGNGASSGLLALLADGQVAVDENASGAAEQHSLQRCPNGSGGARHTASFLTNMPTAGAASNCLIDNPPGVTAVTPADGATGVSIDANLTLTFSEPVTLAAGAVALSCSPGGSRSVFIDGGPTTFHIVPQSPLPYLALCTVHVTAAKISDNDTADPPDTPAGDYEWAFTTVNLPTTSILINEIDSDTPGSDIAEFIELFDGGQGNISLTGLVIVFWNGQDDKSYHVIDLAGKQTDVDGYFLLGNPDLPGVDLTFPNSGLQNGPDAIGLYVGDSSSFPDGTALTTTGLMDAIVYGPVGEPDAQLLTLLDAGQAQLDEDSRGAITGHSLQRCPNGAGSPRQTESFQPDIPTPGEANSCVLDSPPAVAQVTPEPDTVVSVETYLTIAFNEPVALDAGWYEIACEESGDHPALISGGASVYKLTPVTPFAPDEACIVTLYADAVHDEDSDDPPDVMEKDYTWSFHTAEADPPPVAGFTSNSPVWLGQEVHFTNTTTGNGLISFVWDFGDGSATSTAVHPSHLYTAAGHYLVTLTATGQGTAKAIGEVVVLAHQYYLPMLAR